MSGGQKIAPRIAKRKNRHPQKKKPKVTVVNPCLCLHHPGFCAFRAFFFVRKQKNQKGRCGGAKMMDDTEQTTKAKWQTA